MDRRSARADAAALLASFTLIPLAVLLVTWLLPWWMGVFFLAAVSVGWQVFGKSFSGDLRRRSCRLEASALVGARVRIHSWTAAPHPPPFHSDFEVDLEAARQPNWWVELTIAPSPKAGAPFPFARLRNWRPRDLVLWAPHGEGGTAIRRVAVHDGRDFLLDDVGLKTLGTIRVRLLIAVPTHVQAPMIHYLGVPLARLEPPPAAAAAPEARLAA